MGVQGTRIRLGVEVDGVPAAGRGRPKVGGHDVHLAELVGEVDLLGAVGAPGVRVRGGRAVDGGGGGGSSRAELEGPPRPRGTTVPLGGRHTGLVSPTQIF